MVCGGLSLNKILSLYAYAPISLEFIVYSSYAPLVLKKFS